MLLGSRSRSSGLCALNLTTSPALGSNRNEFVPLRNSRLSYPIRCVQEPMDLICFWASGVVQDPLRREALAMSS
jgi:hypothetical protein